MPATSMCLRKFRGGSSEPKATSSRRLVSYEKDSTAGRKRQRRDWGFDLSRTWRNLDESQSDLTHDAALELGNGKSIQTFVHNGQPQDHPADGIHFSTSVQQHAEVRDLENLKAAYLRQTVV